MSVAPRPVLRFVPVVAVVALLTAGCATPTASAPDATASPEAPTSPSATPSTPSPVETEATTDELALPESCDALFTGDLRAQLEADLPPLNDPGVTMYSTENAEALTILESGLPSLRCTWGLPSDTGIATTVSIVTPEQSDAIADTLGEAGFGAEATADGEYFRTSQEMLTMEDDLVELGETHFLRANVWIATRWINYGPEEYTPGIVDALWP